METNLERKPRWKPTRREILLAALPLVTALVELIRALVD
jgi:hypothetical protein